MSRVSSSARWSPRRARDGRLAVHPATPRPVVAFDVGSLLRHRDDDGPLRHAAPSNTRGTYLAVLD